MNAQPEIPTIQVLYFTGPNCSVCKALKPKIKQLISNEFPSIALSFINVEEKPETAAQHMVFTLPVIIISVDSKEYYRFARSFSVSDVADKLSRLQELIN